MANSLLDSLNSLLTPDLLSQASQLTGQPQGAVSKGLGAAFPAVLAGLADKAGDPNAFKQIYALINDPANDGSLLQNAGAALGGSSSMGQLGAKLLSSLFGGRTDAIGRLLSEFAGIQGGSGGSLLSFATPLVLSLLGDRARRQGLGPSGLANLLEGQRDGIQAALPGGIARVLGARERSASVTTPLPAPEARSSANRWLWPLALAALAFVVLWNLLRGPSHDVARTAPPTPVAIEKPVAAPPPVAAAPPQAAFSTLQLPDGVSLEGAPDGIETRLITFLGSPSYVVDETTWFDFDRLLFETGSATLEPESQVQLRNIASILKAFPQASVKIGGYTDNVGDPASNLALSQARAASVVSALEALGVSGSRLSAEGYGETNPIADNSSDPGRAKNRRIALRVSQK